MSHYNMRNTIFDESVIALRPLQIRVKFVLYIHLLYISSILGGHTGKYRFLKEHFQDSYQNLILLERHLYFPTQEYDSARRFSQIFSNPFQNPFSESILYARFYQNIGQKT